MFQRPYILLKCISPHLTAKSSSLSDVILRLPLGCTTCQLHTFFQPNSRNHYRNLDGKELTTTKCQYWQQQHLSQTSFLKSEKKGNSDVNQTLGFSKASNKDQQLKKEQAANSRNNESVLPESMEKNKNINLLSLEKDKKELEVLSKVIEKDSVVAMALSQKDLPPVSPLLENKFEVTPEAILLTKTDKSGISANIDHMEPATEKSTKDELKSEISKKELPAVTPPVVKKETPQKMLLEKAKSILRKTPAHPVAEGEERSVKKVDLGPPKGEVPVSPPPRRREVVDLNRRSLERNFITPVRAMADFLLKPSDLEGLRKTKRRSPYENDPPITVYWRKDVEAKAVEVWGSKENLLKEVLTRDIERKKYQQTIFTAKRKLRDYRREQGRETEIKLEQDGLFGHSGKVVVTAILVNACNFIFKLMAWLYTGSHSMFSEAIHSMADTINQLILAYGIHKSVQRADSDHPYGYANMRYVSSLISGVGIFCVGSGLSLYHGVIGLTDPTPLPSFYWAFFILGGSLVSEGATLLVAFNSVKTGARIAKMSLSEYVWRSHDPSVNVVLLEDLAAVIGVTIAGSCMALSSAYNSHIPDAIGSLLVGGLLGAVASFIIYTNVAALVGRSIIQERLDIINSELESDVMIRAIHDVKGIDMGNSLVRYKAEMDFDGGELTRSYLDKQDLTQMLEEVQKMQTIDEIEQFLMKHGENIVDMLGGEIDRIELKLRKKHPEIRHCDLEIL